MSTGVVIADEVVPLLLPSSSSDCLNSSEPAPNQGLVSLDDFRGLIVALMILVDDAGGAFPSINHSPWFGATVADFVMPFFFFSERQSRTSLQCTCFCKPLYTLSYMCITSGASGLVLTIIIHVVDGAETLLQTLLHSKKVGNSGIYYAVEIILWSLGTLLGILFTPDPQAYSLTAAEELDKTRDITREKPRPLIEL